MKTRLTIIGVACILAGILTGSYYAEDLAEGAKTTKRNYMNDPFVHPAQDNYLVLPETWPIYYNREPLDRSPQDKPSKLLTMGTGDPAANTYRFGPAMALIVNDYPYFIDCGEGWFRALNRSAITQKGVDLIKVFDLNNLKYLFLTHLHEDHTVGIPSFILSPYKYGSATDKVIFGPSGTEDLVDCILLGWQVDRQTGTQGPTHASPAGSSAAVGEIDPDNEFPGPFFEDDNVKVEAFRTYQAHGSLKYTYAYRFTTKPDGRIIAFGGDGHYTKGLVEAAKDADILVMEGCTWKNLKYAPWGGKTLAEKEKNIGALHMFPKDMKRVQEESGVKAIVMVHEQNYSSPENFNRLALLHEMQEAGVKNIYSTMDGDLY
ncbi:MAG: MBL fold metallo-hydrolase [Deltaproteobacteria bacterium]|nr:MBL fold metallo-hydrolase [Deltaproteobacteria bacterium]